MKIIPKNEKDIDGIIHEIRRKNFHQFNDYIGSSASSVHRGSYVWSEPSCLFNYEDTTSEALNNWCSDNVPLSNFSVYFYQTNFILLTIHCNLEIMFSMICQ